MAKIKKFLLTLFFALIIPFQVFAVDEFSTPYVLDLPQGILPPIIPDNNPLTKGKVMLGRKLYFDKRLSADNTISCATCHDPRLGFADGKPVGEGINGQKGARNSPTTLNAAFFDFQFWDGRSATLEEQAKQPIVNPIEMGMKSHDVLIKKLRGIKEYVDLFKKVFGAEKFTIDHVAQAIASFERTLILLDSPFYRFIAGDENAISESAKRGWALFNSKARCNTCHGFSSSFPFFTDNKFHNIGIGAKHLKDKFDDLARTAQEAKTIEDLDNLALGKDSSELGRFIVTKKKSDIGAFKTSGLTNIALTAPYMHDGSERTLESVIEFYNRGGEPNPFLDGGIRPLGLSNNEVKDLVEFMKALTSSGIEKFKEEFSGDLK